MRSSDSDGPSQPCATLPVRARPAAGGAPGLRSAPGVAALVLLKFHCGHWRHSQVDVTGPRNVPRV